MQVGVTSLNFPWVLYCWFARDVMAAMLMVKNKSTSLVWEQNSTFMYIIQEKIYCVDPQRGRLQLSCGCKPRIPGKMPKYFPTIFEHFKSYFKGDNFSML